MSGRIDHVARSLAVMRHALNNCEGEEALISLATAQLDATLALVEQQRIANLIALAACAANPDVHEVLSEAAHSVLDALIATVQDSLDDEHVEIADDIKAALGIEVAR